MYPASFWLQVTALTTEVVAKVKLHILGQHMVPKKTWDVGRRPPSSFYNVRSGTSYLISEVSKQLSVNPIFWIVVAQTSNIQPLTCKQKCIVVADRGETCSFSGLPISEQFTDHEPSVCRALVAFGRREMESVDMISFQVSRDWDLRNLDNQKVPTIGP